VTSAVARGYPDGAARRGRSALSVGLLAGVPGHRPGAGRSGSLAGTVMHAHEAALWSAIVSGPFGVAQPHAHQPRHDAAQPGQARPSGPGQGSGRPRRARRPQRRHRIGHVVQGLGQHHQVINPASAGSPSRRAKRTRSPTCACCALWLVSAMEPRRDRAERPAPSLWHASRFRRRGGGFRSKLVICGRLGLRRHQRFPAQRIMRATGKEIHLRTTELRRSWGFFIPMATALR
jgi:hypothetical protein